MLVQSGRQILAVVAASAAMLVLLLAPGNLPLYELVLFPLPDPRTPTIQSELQTFRSQGLNAREVDFPAANGRLLHGVFLERPDTRRVFLYSHGKGNNIYIQMMRARLLLSCGASVFMYDYQGYGRSEGRPSITGTCDDAVAAYDYLVRDEKRTGKDIIAVGVSWGSGPTGQLVRHRPVAGVIMQAGFSSLRDAGRDTFFWLRLYPDWAFPSSMVLDNVAVFTKPHPPLLIIHGKTDTVIPCTEAQLLYAKACEPKSILLLPKGHSTVGSGNEFAGTVRRFLAENHI